MISYLINLTSPFFIAWFAANFTPVQSLLDWVYQYVPDKIQFTRDYLNCFKCLAFWITLGMTMDPILAMVFSMGAYTWTRWINNFKMYL